MGSMNLLRKKRPQDAMVVEQGFQQYPAGVKTSPAITESTSDSSLKRRVKRYCRGGRARRQNPAITESTYGFTHTTRLSSLVCHSS